METQTSFSAPVDRMPIVAIVGVPNVGKSTLFNRMVGSKKAIVEDFPGVTRDRNYAVVERRYPIPFLVVDTGGIDGESEDPLATHVREQAMLAMQEADIIIALFDGQAGLQPGDHEVVKILRRERKPVLFAVNKCDGKEQAVRAAEFYELGVSELFDCSALHGRGVESLVQSALQSLPDYAERAARHKERVAIRELEAKAAFEAFKEENDIPEDEDELVEPEDGAEDEEELVEAEPEFAPVFIPGDEDASENQYLREFRVAPLTEGSGTEFAPPEIPEEYQNGIEASELPESIECIRIAIVGRPNVGKSTMLNTLLGEARAIVSPLAGTTRDTLDTELEKWGQRFALVDTAGVRRESRIDDKLERYSVLRSLSALSSCDVAVLMLDATEGPTEQDARLAGLAHEQGRGLVIAVNKWDAVEKDHRTVHDVKEALKARFKFATYAPIVFTSARSGRRCDAVLKHAREVAFERLRRVGTSKLNRVLTANLRRVTAPSYRGAPVKLFFATQVDVAPPRFALFVNHPQGVHFSYLRYIKNILRENFGFSGTDVKLMTRKK